jgi:ABC-type lipoprotein export system ATPase subunit
MIILEIAHLTKKYGDRSLFSGFSFSFPDCGFFLLCGESGSGKSTFLNILAGLDPFYEGRCVYLGKDYQRLSGEERSELRLREIGYIQQSGNLLETETALYNVLLPLVSVSSMKWRFKKQKALDALASVGLKEKVFQQVNTLSGGEKQRVAIARALMCDPPMILADEPTGALDRAASEEIYSLLRILAAKRLIIIVSHDTEAARRYASAVFWLQDGQIALEPISNELSQKSGFRSVVSFPDKEKSKVPLSYWFTHAYHVGAAKKWRTLLSETIVSFALLSLGLTCYVGRDVGKSVEGAFSSLVGENILVMETPNKGEATFGKTISASESDLKNLIKSMPAFIDDYGLTYIANFEAYFPDLNEAYLPHGASKIVIPSLSIRTVNDFLWLDEENSQTYFPEKPKTLEDDQIVLGLPYASMASVCFGLQILRNYDTLGAYISESPLQVVFALENQSWSYTDEQILSVVAITQTSVPTIFHFNHRWSTYLYEEKMRFPSSDEPDNSLPWIMQKLFYLKPKGSCQEFIEQSRFLDSLADYVFERPNESFEATHCRAGSVCGLSRLYVFLADKHSLRISDILSVSQENGIDSFYVCTDGSYVAFPEAYMMGFASRFFLSVSASSIDQAIDLMSSLSDDDNLLLPDDIVEGSYLCPASSALTFSSNFSALIHGRPPRGNEEICLSSTLYDSLNAPESVLVAGAVGGKDYRKVELKVVGVVRSERKMIYGNSFWPIDFFREGLGMSAFLLEPTKVVYEVGENAADNLSAQLAARYPEFIFTDPSLEARESISAVVDQVSFVLSAFSGFALLVAALLFFVVGFLAVVENRKEAIALYRLGISRDDIAESYSCGLFLQAAIAVTPSAISLSLLEKIVDDLIKGNFGSGGTFVYDQVPILFMLATAFFGTLCISLLLWFLFRKRSFVNR